MIQRRIIDWTPTSTTGNTARVWRPEPLDRTQWPPDYSAVYRWRTRVLRELMADGTRLASARAYYSTRPAQFIMDWLDTYDPRKSPTNNNPALRGEKWMPFVFFERQLDVIQFFEDCSHDQESGLVEKCRDFGLTWLACAYSVWRWLFIKNDAIGWGSRKESLVDKPGDPDSIFEKIRLMMKRMPKIWMPAGFSWGRHSTFMKLLNPENGAIIAGEAGDNIGRGGRRSAQPLDTLVMTPKGLRELGSLRVGDYVIGSDGKPTKVIHIVDWGERQVYKVHFTDGTWTECDAEHLWQVNIRLGSKKTVIKDTQSLMKDYIYNDVKYDRKMYRYDIPFVKPIQFDVSHQKLPLDGYIVGALLGDGNVAGAPKTVVKFTCADQEILDEFNRLLPEHCELRQSRKYDYRVVDTRPKKGSGERYRKSIIRQAVLKAGIAGMKAENKYIPDLYKYGSIKTRLAVLQGLMDTDGSAGSRTLTFTSTSKKLSMDVRFLVESLGGRATYNIKHDKRGFKDCHCLQISIPKELPPFRLTRKLERFYQRKNKISRTINKIEPSRITNVRCIQVENLDGLYTLSHCILTHNCYFLDEAAHVERAEKIEAALGDTTHVRIDISSVNGVGNVFHRRRENGVVWQRGEKILPGYVRVFIADWRDHPLKTQDWYDKRKARYEREGMAHIFAQEVDRNYAAAVSNVVIPYDWIEAAINAHIDIPYFADAVPEHLNEWYAGLDVADEGNDRNALTLREWVIWRSVEEWGERDPGLTARKAIIACREHAGHITCMYDCIGVGSGVKTEYNRLTTDEHIVDANRIPFIPWNAGASVVDPWDRIIPDDNESLQNKDFFDNLKAQAWWSLRTRFYKTFKARIEGAVYPVDELISIDGTMPLLEQLKKELAQPTVGHSSRLKLLIEKKPDGMRSPNLADSGVLAFFPVADNNSDFIVGSYGVG